MKAITCPQCGALLEDVSIEKNIARCSYCRAKILIRPFGESKEEVEVSLVTRAEGGKEEKEVYQRGNFTFTKQKFQPNDFLRQVAARQAPKRKGEGIRSFGLFVLILGIIAFALIAVYLS
ncbi:MAG TPA: hypothetical protein VF599_24625 [Pyrinomonadaceae bacterium]|jgi:DNA-directed RNA polymerase subunit RPC12/RpoP